MTTQALSPSPMISRGLVTPDILRAALVESFVKLLPQHQWRNPVMFVVYLGSILTTILWVQALGGGGEAAPGFILHVTIWLWFTVLFANFAEAIAKKLKTPERTPDYQGVPSTTLRKGDLYLVEAGDLIPVDGEVIEGVASV